MQVTAFFMNIGNYLQGKKLVCYYFDFFAAAEECEQVNRLCPELNQQWSNLRVELGSVQSMLDEVSTNWDTYLRTVEELQGWLENGEMTLHQGRAKCTVFFQNLPYWVQQQTAMNEAGNFLISTCIENISNDIMQQLLLLNGRWKELYEKVKHYAQIGDGLEYQVYKEGEEVLQSFVERICQHIFKTVKLSQPDLEAFIGNVERIADQIPAAEDQWRNMSKQAKSIAHHTPPEEVKQMDEVLSSIKDSIKKVRDIGPSLLQGAKQLLPATKDLENSLTEGTTCLAEVDLASINDSIEPEVLKKALEGCKNSKCKIKGNMQNVSKLMQKNNVLQQFDKTELEESVNKMQQALHSKWTQGPHILAKLKFTKKEELFTDMVQKCEFRLAAETRSIATTAIGQLIWEHTTFFSDDAGAYCLAHKHLKDMRATCADLHPDGPEAKKLRHCENHLQEVEEYVLRMQDHLDKLNSVNKRLTEVRDWMASAERSIGDIRLCAQDTGKHEELRAKLEGLDKEHKQQRESLRMLQSLLGNLVCAPEIVQRKRKELQMVSEHCDFLQKSHREVEDLLSASAEQSQLKLQAQCLLEGTVSTQKEMQSQVGHMQMANGLQQALEHHKVFQKLVLTLLGQQEQVRRLLAGGLGTSGPVPQSSELGSLVQSLPKELDEQERKAQALLEFWQKLEGEKQKFQQLQAQAVPMLQSQVFSGTSSLAEHIRLLKELLLRTEEQSRNVQDCLRDVQIMEPCEENAKGLKVEATSLLQVLSSISDNLQISINSLNIIKEQWENFLMDSEAFSSWLAQSEQRLQAIERSSDDWDGKLKRTKAICVELEGKQAQLQALEGQTQTLSSSLSPAEMSRLRGQQAHLQWRGETLGGQLHSVEADAAMNIQHEEMVHHTIEKDVKQEVEGLRGSISSLSAEASRLSCRLNDEVVVLRKRYDEDMMKAVKKQQELGALLDTWQRYENGRDAFVSWLEESEVAVSPTSPRVPANPARLDSELKVLKELQQCTKKQEISFQSLLLEADTLQSVAPESQEEIGWWRKQLCERWEALPVSISCRVSFLQDAKAAYQQYEEISTKLSEWTLQFQIILQSTGEVNIKDLKVASSLINTQATTIQEQAGICRKARELAEQSSEWLKTQDTMALHQQMDELEQRFCEVEKIVNARQEAIGTLSNFLEQLAIAELQLQQLGSDIETDTSFGQSESEVTTVLLHKVSSALIELEPAAASLDGLLSRSQLCLCEESAEKKRLSCRIIVEKLLHEELRVRELLGVKQSQAEETKALWQHCLIGREQLQNNVESIVQKANDEVLKEPTLFALQQRLRFFTQLEKDLETCQQQLVLLVERTEKLASRNADLVEDARKWLEQFRNTIGDISKLVSDRKYHCSGLVTLMRDYQNCKATLNHVVENAESLIMQKLARTSREDVRRLQAKHETVRSELSTFQEQLDEFASKGRGLLAELRKVKDCDTTALKAETENLLDSWLDVSERLEENTENLRASGAQWEDIQRLSSEAEVWSVAVLLKLSPAQKHTGQCHQLDQDLQKIEDELEKQKENLDCATRKMEELKQRLELSDLPSELQALQVAFSQQVAQVYEGCKASRVVQREFASRKTELESQVEDLGKSLSSAEASCTQLQLNCNPEDMPKVEQIQKELMAQQGDIDTVRENLNSLCREYQTEELEGVGQRVAGVVRSYDAVKKLCADVQNKLQGRAERELNDALQNFTNFLAEVKTSVKDCNSTSGDAVTVETKLQKLKDIEKLEPEVQKLLGTVFEAAEQLARTQPKHDGEQARQQAEVARENWDNFSQRCRKDEDSLTTALSTLNTFECQVKELSLWLNHIEKQLSSEGQGELCQSVSEKRSEVEKLKDLQQEILKKREEFQKLADAAQAVDQAGAGDGSKLQGNNLFENFQGLIRLTQSKLQDSQQTLHEHQAFEEALKGTWSCVRRMKDRLPSMDSTIGNQETLEKRLSQIQEILFAKGEGEVKLNMAIGKGDRVMTSSSEAGQEVIKTQLHSLHQAFNELNEVSLNYHSCLEKLNQEWQHYKERKKNFIVWLDNTAQQLALPPQAAIDIKEKEMLVERASATLADIEGQAPLLDCLLEKAQELLQTTGDATFREDITGNLRSHYYDVATSAKERVVQLESNLQDHKQWLGYVNDINTWLHSACEELNRWKDAAGDADTLQKKLIKVKELLSLRKGGTERKNHVHTQAEVVKRNTAQSGHAPIDTEVLQMQNEWNVWEEQALKSEAELEAALCQAMSTKQKFEVAYEGLQLKLKLVEGEVKQMSEVLCGVSKVEGTDVEVVAASKKAKEVQEKLFEVEQLNEDVKTLLHNLCSYSKDVGPLSDSVYDAIREHSRLKLQASRLYQDGERLLRKRLQASQRDFQQWMALSRASLSKEPETYNGVDGVREGLHKIQGVLLGSEGGHSKLNTFTSKAELLLDLVGREQDQGLQAEVEKAHSEWHDLISALHAYEAKLQRVQDQLNELEGDSQPVQHCVDRVELLLSTSKTLQPNLSSKREAHELMQVSQISAVWFHWSL
uniref:Nesprin-1 n=1 Tax=Eptatretus burgeri TaxID=7764 RepID=A0A8C4Q0K8_EPTBU